MNNIFMKVIAILILLSNSLFLAGYSSAAPPNYGEVNINTGIAGAYIYVDGKKTGITGSDGKVSIKMKPGKYGISLHKDEWIYSYVADDVIEVFKDNSIKLDYNLNERILNTAFILAILKDRELESVLEVANSIKTDHLKDDVLRDIAVVYAKSGDKNKALEIANSIKTDYWKDDALSGVGVEFAKSGDKNKALEIANSIKTDHLKDDVLRDIAIESGDQEMASILADAEMEKANLILDSYDRSSALYRIAIKYADSGDQEMASNILNMVLEIVNTVKYGEERLDIHIAMAIGYAKSGDQEIAYNILGTALGTALKIADAIKDDPKELSALVGRINEATKYGDQEIAFSLLGTSLETANIITDSDERLSALRSIAVGYAYAGYKNRALEVVNGIADDDNKLSVLLVVSAIPDEGFLNAAEPFDLRSSY